MQLILVSEIDLKKKQQAKNIEQPNLINDSHIVCTNCSTVNGYLTGNESGDFYENR